uniref:Uncharacterized protein n=1 Tax=Trypanosoma congolense (strain IL3000) TaxID=1068625 RepID=G0ULB3_TRYCI|nr:hypothetical protein, unlikely [Trypanosoma congolense IL3000]
MKLRQWYKSKYYAKVVTVTMNREWKSCEKRNMCIKTQQGKIFKHYMFSFFFSPISNLPKRIKQQHTLLMYVHISTPPCLTIPSFFFEFFLLLLLFFFVQNVH